MAHAYFFDAPDDLAEPRALRRVFGRAEHEHPSSASADDLRLVDRVRQGDDPAFGELFQRFAPQLAAYAYGFVRSREVAEEIVQDVFLRIWARRQGWQVQTTIQAYLHSAVRSRALDHLKHGEVQSRYRLVGESGAAPERPDLQLVRDEEVRRVRRAIAELPDRVREALALRWHGELTYAEIAVVMGISARTVEHHLANGLRQLRVRLGAE